jgi:oligo-1,6-glucosidase
LRHADPVVTDGDFELLLPDHPAIWAFLRRGPDTELLVAANFSADVVKAPLPLDSGWADAPVVLANLPDQEPLQPLPDLTPALGIRHLAPSGPRNDSAYSL